MMRHVLGLLLFVVGLPFMAVADTRAVSVTDAWSRPATGTGVVYATLHNNAAVADHLIGASSPLARHIGLHQTSEMKMSGMSTSMGNMPMAGSMTSMKSVPSIPVPAHGTTALAPGGYHLMLDLRSDLKAGETVPLRLHFARAGWVTASAQVRPIR
ncbi:MAG: copper chaperone PCu(A)C [Candidatus Velthaea sp.]|jgi:copper(I)-binding protein